jgi:glycosyltransferase involved in cell wall biosynthesis
VLAVALADSDLADTMRQAEAGWVVPPNEPGQFAAVLREISRMSAEALDEIGRAGQHYAQKNFSREECLPRVLDALDRAAASMR